MIHIWTLIHIWILIWIWCHMFSCPRIGRCSNVVCNRAYTNWSFSFYNISYEFQCICFHMFLYPRIGRCSNVVCNRAYTNWWEVPLETDKANKLLPQNWPSFIYLFLIICICLFLLNFFRRGNISIDPALSHIQNIFNLFCIFL